MLYAAILLTGLVLLYFLYEKRANDRRLASFQFIVHVNGIRGKTSVCRLLDAVFREAGFRVFTKTTGSTPYYLDTEGREHLIHRHGPANIGEQLRIIRKAASEHAEVLILECMAVSPELQRAAQEQIVKGTFNVITNVRYDHVFEMGGTLEAIAEALSGTIPENGLLLTADADFYPYFREICEKKHTRAVLCTAEKLPLQGAARASDAKGAVQPASIPAALHQPSIPPDNLAIAYAAAKELRLSDEAFLHCLSNYHEDFGARRLYSLADGSLFYNLFSANDPVSTKCAVDELLQELRTMPSARVTAGDTPARTAASALITAAADTAAADTAAADTVTADAVDTATSDTDTTSGTESLPLIFLYNHRTDRPDRLLLFARYFFPAYPNAQVFVTGENTGFAIRYLRKYGVFQAAACHLPDGSSDAPLPLPAKASSGSPLWVGIGNIKGCAYELISRLEQGADAEKKEWEC